MHQISTPKISRRLVQLGNLLIVIILVLLPFHALFTTWLSSNFGHADLFKIWKELLLVPLGFISLWILVSTPVIRKRVLHSWLFWVTLAYALYSIALGLWSHGRGMVNSSALIYGLLINLRFPIFLIFTWVISLKSNWLYRYWKEILIGPALVVVGFGFLQRLVLPIDFLRHFGYGPKTIPAIQTVDQEVGYRRLQSTLRGSNPLGAYLTLVITALVGVTVSRKSKRLMGLYLVGAASIVLFLTYSRSAYIGVVLGVAFSLWFLLPRVYPRRPWRKWLLTGGLIMVVAGALSVVALRNNDSVQNIAFHSSEHSLANTSSNASRANAVQQGLKDIKSDPMGRGPGTAGPASVRNYRSARIAENYFIQIVQEVGVLGFLLFIAINILVGWQLWLQRTDLLSLILLSSLLAITLISMLSHAWADDTLSLIWWGFAGIALSRN
jgi:hypothetical protein